jgi:hypothetical protein
LNKPAIISIFAAALLALGSVGAVAAGATKSGAKNSGDPPRISTTGAAQRSPTAKTKGANNPKFCPPGQREKAGKGSAFQC